MTRKLVTNEEAIKCLTVELGLRAEGYHSYLSHYGKQDKAEEEFLDSLQTAIAALREQEERSKGCEYCNGNGKCLRTDYDYSSFNTICLDNGKAFLNDADGNDVPIEFCPVCGRRLEEV